jgi:hypothetical protein
VGRDHRRTYGDSWHLRHELPIHARAGLAIRLRSDSRRNGRSLQRAVVGVQAVGLAVGKGAAKHASPVTDAWYGPKTTVYYIEYRVRRLRERVNRETFRAK